MNTAAFFRRLPGDPARHSLECRIFNVIMLAASVAGLIATIYNLLIDNNYYQIGTAAFGSLSGLLLYGYSYRTGLYQGASLIFILLFMGLISLAWMTNAGTQGSGGYFFMLLTTFGILLQPRRVPLFLTLLAGLIAVLLQLEYLHPQLLIGYDNRLQQFLDIGISIIVCLVFNGLIINVVYQEYRRERQANETLLAQTLRDKEQLQQAQQENQVLLREVYHRTKNNMLVIIAMLRLRARDFADPAVQEVFADTEYRIRAMALVHEQLYQAKHLHQLNFTAYLQEMVTTLLGSMIFDGRVRLELALAPLTLPIDKAVPLGLAVNELVTNALKHAFPGGRAGRIALRLHCQAGIMELQIRDDGIGLPEQGVQPAEVSCGQQIAASLVRDQLGGELISENDGGASHTIRLTLPAG